ncbi:PD-(D/E)XK nuclease family protein [Sinanaerobacter chloroacetimidivorans]|uniref:PD-(D/E)XK nuclease family protein n=1 Tax=Sinanaerobacter chloroacetimidivorans TaxID=2818044 RepID=A0A8J7W2K4_9FIRM|nr:PD-(D/E)XK nuclease family protein [Sinanaerobacter chloroacetimidivorans]MBR0598008.1 PD-(D/E)XK nuclease family protein [Sinanaerobacter chloroacetimidivorans]
MLHIFYGREDLDKDKFLFERIAAELNQDGADSGNHRKILLLVPDQFTLQAERNAFACLGVPGLMDLEVLSQSRLGFKVLEETGGGNRVHIDKYGRHMLLAKILSDNKDSFTAFRGMHLRNSFIEMANNLISEMKQFNTSPKDMLEVMKAAEETSLLYRKLEDIHRIYESYENLIEGKYIDTEDYLNLFVMKIRESEMVRNSVIWINGFDYFTPKTLDIIEQLMVTAKEVNILLTSDTVSFPTRDSKNPESGDSELFQLTKTLMDKLKIIAMRQGISVSESPVGAEYRIPVGQAADEKSEALAHLEHELYAYPFKKMEASPSVTLCRAANFYAEAETAAAMICRLVREEGFRYRDIAVICNDMEERASVIKRVFADYGISVFLDKKRDILHNPVVTFITSLIDVAANGYLYEDLFRLLKTDLMPVTSEEYEDLENYVLKYKIKGNRFQKEFQYGSREEGEEALARLNQIRRRIYEYISVFEKTFHQGKTVKEKTAALYYFLRDDAGIPDLTETMIQTLQDDNQFEYAEETAQIWGVILGIFDQIIELIGEESLSSSDYGNILKAGFEAVEIGLLPPTMDQIIVGTMQRTRTGKLKALLVIGANDGLLPASSNTEGLLSEDEKAVLFQKGIEICKVDDLRLKEETLAIYKTLSKPLKYLWMSYSASDSEGKESKQSIIFDKIRKIYNNPEIIKDIINQEEPMARITAPRSTLRHLTEALRNSLEGEALADEWRAAYGWFRNAEENLLARIEEGIFFTNKQKKIEKELIGKLYRKEGLSDIVISPSRLEKFSRCPFSHLIGYGIKPEELRVFEIAGREIGDIYHYCFMKLSQGLTLPGVPISDPASPWMQLTREECKSRIHSLIEEASLEYKEGVLIQGKEEKYRSSRMKTVCAEAAWALVEHVQKGRIREVYFESEFGKGYGKKFPPITIEAPNNQVLIEGKIDRVDILPGNYIKIIDYKSGKERFDTEEARKGWRLQLMLYLRAVLGEMFCRNAADAVQEDSLPKPAGVFYFEIAEPQIDASNMNPEDYSEKVMDERKKSYRLDGIVLDHPDIIESITGEFSGYSEILPVRKTKDGTYSGTTDKKILKEEEFLELCQSVDSTIENLCGELLNGSIDIRPKKVKDETACKFCRYKSICCFDLSFEGCSYETIK